MAAVTVNGNTFQDIARTRRVLYNVTGANGSTLATGLLNILAVFVQPTATNNPTGITITGGTVTFAAGGTFTTNIEVIGQ